ncbi:hypothetical protein [Streptomyces sp. AC1-42T]|uniref:hypothetical protein n=1 Tax=Streptomyces sp. AC1-42T TaxID=2218665 RepID=UPI000DAF9DEB|nr:hypothetical protein [Streptomyces sp. AC1-42T]PZT71527.1 hypothetical protein DNK55_32980 [Streptomyces sp. AC1-42T]
MADTPHWSEADRRAETVRMRQSGKDFQEIADALGFPDRAAAATAFADAFDDGDHLDPAVRHQAESHSLDALQDAIWQTALGGDLDAIEAVLRLSERRSRLHGLDAPTRLEVALAPLDVISMTDAELEELLALGGDPPI